MTTNAPISFEFFPTKTEAGHEKLLATAQTLAAAGPEFFSVTYGAGGSTRDGTRRTVLQLDGEVKVPTAPHLSCVGDSREDLRTLINDYRANGIQRIVALRGDLPSGMGHASGELRYANELVEFIRAETGDHFTIEVAAYPESHPQAPNFETDLQNFIRKARAGADSAITQYFFTADAYFHFVDRVRAMGVEIPIVEAGATMLGQTHTKTMTQVEADDDDQARGVLGETSTTTRVRQETDDQDHDMMAFGGTRTLTEVQQEADDQDQSLAPMAETSTLTKVRQEADDQDASLALPELQTKTDVQQETDDQAGMLI